MYDLLGFLPLALWNLVSENLYKPSQGTIGCFLLTLNCRGRGRKVKITAVQGIFSPVAWVTQAGSHYEYIPRTAIICAFSPALTTDRSVAQACNRTRYYALSLDAHCSPKFPQTMTAQGIKRGSLICWVDSTIYKSINPVRWKQIDKRVNLYTK